MTPTPYDTWVMARVLSNQPGVNGELANMSDAWRPAAEKLANIAPGSRQLALDVLLCIRPDQDAIVKAIVDIRPNDPPPAPAANVRAFATAADIRGMQTAADETWGGFIPAAKIFGIAAFEGVG